MAVSKTRFNVTNYAVVILAAGSSSRLGSPKQLLTYKGTNLLQHSINSAKQLKADRIIVILGANKEFIEKEISSEGITLIGNTNWASGIASSITTGIKALKLLAPQTDGILLMVCDQPFADVELLDAILIKQAESGKAIVGCEYEQTKGTPAFFHSSLFPDLLLLQGDSGAKKLFEQYKQVAAFIPFTEGGIDIDTSEDYQNMPK